jgi:predicted PurR-regulated permease PerM
MQRTSRAQIIKLSAVAVAALVLIIVFWHVFISVLVMAVWGLAIAAILLPMTRKLEKRMKRGAAAVLSMALMMTVILLLFGIVLPALIQQIEQIIAQLPTLIESVNAFTDNMTAWLDSVGMPPFPAITTALSNFDAQAILMQIVSTAGGLVSRLAQVLMIPMIAFYFLKDREKFGHRMAMLVPLKYRRKAIWMAVETKRALLLYLRGHILLSGIIGACMAVGLLWFKVGAWLALGLWIALANLVPYFGPAIGAIPIVLMSPVIGWNRMLWSLILIFVFNQLEGMFAPRFLGESTGMHPVTVLAALMIGEMLLGLWGLILSLPLLIVVKTALRAARAQ